MNKVLTAEDFVNKELLTSTESSVIMNYVRCLHNQSIGQLMEKDRFVIENSEKHLEKIIEDSGLTESEKKRITLFIQEWVEREKNARREMYRELNTTNSNDNPMWPQDDKGRILKVFKDDKISTHIHPEDPSMQKRFNRIAEALKVDIELVKEIQRNRYNPSNAIAV